jgi:hypothetical protein
MRQEFISELIERAESLIEFIKTELASSEVSATPQTPNKKEDCQ